MSYAIEAFADLTIEGLALATAELREAFTGLIDYIKPSSTLRVKRMLTNIPVPFGWEERQPYALDLWQATWNDILKMREAFGDGRPHDAIKILYKIDDKDFGRINLISFFSVQKWTIACLQKISEVETKELSGELTEEEKAAGVGGLKKFGYAVSLDLLANGDVLKYEALLHLPYLLIFRQLCLIKEKNEINRRFLDNSSKKIK